MSEHLSELNKWSNCHEDVIVIEDFLEWLETEGILLCTHETDEWGTRFSIVSKSHRQLLEKYFRIDPIKLEQERREILSGYEPIKKEK